MDRITHYRSGLPTRLATQQARKSIGQALIWVAAFALILLVGRISMDDEIVAEQMRRELEAAVVTAKAEPRCEPLDRRVAHTASRVANQCASRHSAASRE